MSKIFSENLKVLSVRFGKLAVALCASAFLLSGCVGGTTYGTGVTQEAQLLQDLEGMMSFGSKKKKARIDYSARPDLVLPAQTAALPSPLETESSTSNTNWPENPEARLARIRGEAEVADERSGALSLKEQRRQKTGIKIARSGFDAPDLDRDGHAAIKSLKDGTYKNVKQLKAQYAYSKGPSRKFLTEPPVEYRTPATTAVAGDLGISEAEKEKRAEKAAKVKRQNDTGMWTDG